MLIQISIRHLSAESLHRQLISVVSYSSSVKWHKERLVFIVFQLANMNSSPAIADFRNMSNNRQFTTEPSFSSCLVEQELIENIYFQIVCSFFYFVIFLLGTFGNLLVTFVILRNRSMRNPTNLFITNLAMADILVK